MPIQTRQDFIDEFVKRGQASGDSRQQVEQKLTPALQQFDQATTAGQSPTFQGPPGQVPYILGGRQQAQAEPGGPSGALSGFLNLAVVPTIRGIKGFGELTAAGAGTVGTGALQAVSGLAGEASQTGLAQQLGLTEELTGVSQATAGGAVNLAARTKELREQTGLEGSLVSREGDITQESALGAGKTAFGAGLRTAGGVGAAYNLFTLGTAGSLTGFAKQAARITVRNALVNAGLYGTGSTLQARRKDEDLLDAFMKGVTGENPVGIFQGVLGDDNEMAQTIDVAMSIGLPILFGKYIDRTTNAIVDAPGKGVMYVKNGLTTSKIATNLKQAMSQKFYNARKSDIVAKLKPSSANAQRALKADMDIGDSYVAHDLTEKSIAGNLKKVDKQISAARAEYVKELKANNANVKISDDIFEEVANRARAKASSQSELTAINKWRDFNKTKYAHKGTISLTDLDDARIASADKAFGPKGTIKQTAIADTSADFYFTARGQVQEALMQGGQDRAANLYGWMEEGIVLKSMLKDARVREIKTGQPIGAQTQKIVSRTLNPLAWPKVVGAGAGKITEAATPVVLPPSPTQAQIRADALARQFPQAQLGTQLQQPLPPTPAAAVSQLPAAQQSQFAAFSRLLSPVTQDVRKLQPTR